MIPLKCPHCQNEDDHMIEWLPRVRMWLCIVCSKTFVDPNEVKK